MSGRGDATVYSTEHGRTCPHCSLAIAKCQCRANPRAAKAPAGDGIIRVGRESKGRRGKTVTLVSGLPLPPDELQTLAKALKRRCGTGGSVKDGVIEIQGDQRDVLVAELEARQFKVKRTG
jgi:translation initiation factor 1